jgi:hypothetical protein
MIALYASTVRRRSDRPVSISPRIASSLSSCVFTAFTCVRISSDRSLDVLESRLNASRAASVRIRCAATEEVLAVRRRNLAETSRSR